MNEKATQPEFTQTNKYKKRLAAMLSFCALSACSVFTEDIETVKFEQIETSDEQLREAFSSEPSWEQDFTESSELDSRVWSHQKSYRAPLWNDIESAYTDRPQNVRLVDGLGLVIEARKEKYTYSDDPENVVYDYTSGRINTAGNDTEGFSFEYGLVEAVIKMPEGSGIWPAFWTRSNDKELINQRLQEQNSRNRFTTPKPKQPYLLNGEIDFEVFGRDTEEVQIAHHTYKDKVEKAVYFPENNDAFNRYGIAVSPNRVDWIINGKIVHTEDKKSDNPAYWPYADGNELYIILNLAMGGRGGEIDKEKESWEMIIQELSFYDYILD